MTTIPKGLSTGGANLWLMLTTQDESLRDDLNPLRDVALEACRAKDRCDKLDVVCRTQDVMIDNGKGQPIAHPGWVEARQQANMLKQLIASLRLPDEASGKRPGARPGPLAGRRPSANPVSALEKLRQAKSS